MIDPSNSQPRWKFGTELNNWRVAFLIFAIAYTVVLLLNLTNMPMQWDETTHLNGALYLNSGLYNKFISNSFYPPLYDAITAISFQILGTSMFSARLISANVLGSFTLGSLRASLRLIQRKNCITLGFFARNHAWLFLDLTFGTSGNYALVFCFGSAFLLFPLATEQAG